MTYSRYTRREIFLNEDEGYRKQFFIDRDIEQTFQYEMPKISFPSDEVIASLNNVLQVWGSTDKLYNISNKYYGSPNYWWVIAWYNEKSSEAEFKTGDQYYIPLPLDQVLSYIE